jgi:hypothetical protein
VYRKIKFVLAEFSAFTPLKEEWSELGLNCNKSNLVGLGPKATSVFSNEHELLKSFLRSIEAISFLPPVCLSFTKGSKVLETFKDLDPLNHP